MEKIKNNMLRIMWIILFYFKFKSNIMVICCNKYYWVFFNCNFIFIIIFMFNGFLNDMDIYYKL